MDPTVLVLDWSGILDSVYHYLQIGIDAAAAIMLAVWGVTKAVKIFLKFVMLRGIPK